MDARDNFIVKRTTNFYFLSKIITMNMSKMMRWSGHVARRGYEKYVQNLVLNILKERDNFEDQGVDDGNNKVDLQE